MNSETIARPTTQKTEVELPKKPTELKQLIELDTQQLNLVGGGLGTMILG